MATITPGDSDQDMVKSSILVSNERPAFLRLRTKSYFHSWENYLPTSDEDLQSRTKTPIPEETVVEIPSAELEELEGQDGKDEKDVVSEEEVKHHDIKSVIIFLSLASATLFMAIDESIIATAIPKITQHFGSVQDIGWYGTAYLATGCAFRPVFGKLYSVMVPKWVFLAAVVLFEVGSALCGLAPSANALIIGRAISGIGSAGIATGPGIILAHSIPTRRLPIYTSMINAIYGFASITAPLIGGALTTEVSWRWCFLLNLPIGAVSVTAAWIYVPRRSPTVPVTWSPRTIFKQLDLFGFVCIVPGVMLLIVALQFGGSNFSWHSSVIITLLVISTVLNVAFVIIQHWMGDLATFAPRIVGQRNVIAAAFCSLGIGTAATVMEFYLPLWFQLVKRFSPFKSGLMTLPLVAGFTVSALTAGLLVSRFGHIKPFLIVGSVFTAVGGGLTTRFRNTSLAAYWVIAEIIMAIGAGISVEQPYVAAMTVLSADDVATGITLLSFVQALGSTMSLTFAKVIFTSTLPKATDGGNLDARSAPASLASTKILPVTVLDSYDAATTRPFFLVVGSGVLMFGGAMLMDWISVLKGKWNPVLKGKSDPVLKDKSESKSL